MKRVFGVLLMSLLAATPAAAQMRVEVHGGADRAGGPGINKWGWVAGVGVGYDRFAQDGHGFGGVEANADLYRTKECINDIHVIGDRGCGSAGRDLSVGVRFGYKFDNGPKLYGIFGYSNARLISSYRIGSVQSSSGQNLDGVRFGGGMEFDVGKATYAKLEYRYTGYNKHFRRHNGLVGVGIRF